MDDQHLDGNGVAGLLVEITGADMTGVLRTCQSCGDRGPSASTSPTTRPASSCAARCEDVAIVVGVQEAARRRVARDLRADRAVNRALRSSSVA